MDGEVGEGGGRWGGLGEREREEEAEEVEGWGEGLVGMGGLRWGMRMEEVMAGGEGGEEVEGNR